MIKLVQEKANSGFAVVVKEVKGIWHRKPFLKTIPSKQVENTKAFEQTIIKELGKMTHVTSG